MASASTLRPLVGGYLDLEYFPTGERATCTATLLRSPCGRWRLVLWVGGGTLPVVVEGAEPTPCADAVIAAMFGASVLDHAGD